jgi:hypothetical protein
MPKARKPKEFVVPKEGKDKESSFRRKGKLRKVIVMKKMKG